MVTVIFEVFQSQTLPLFTRGIIKHMATVCLWCQIAHKEWVHCLLGEMVANWYSWLSAIKGHRALTEQQCALHHSNKIAASCGGIALHHISDKNITWCIVQYTYLNFLMFLKLMLTETQRLFHFYWKKKSKLTTLITFLWYFVSVWKRECLTHSINLVATVSCFFNIIY